MRSPATANSIHERCGVTSLVGGKHFIIDHDEIRADLGLASEIAYSQTDRQSVDGMFCVDDSSCRFD